MNVYLLWRHDNSKWVPHTYRLCGIYRDMASAEVAKKREIKNEEWANIHYDIDTEPVKTAS